MTMTEWIALTSKCYDYSYLEDNKIKNKIKNKGIQRQVVEKNMNQLQFKKCLFKNKNHYEKDHSFPAPVKRIQLCPELEDC